MSITWAEVEFLFSWKCLPHRSFCIVGEPTLPSLISFFKLISKKSVPAGFLESLQRSHSVSLSLVRRVPAKLLSTQLCIATARKSRVDDLEACIVLYVAALSTWVTHHPSISIPTVFLRTSSLSSTAFLTLPSPSLPPPLHLPSAVTAIASMRARWASSKSRSCEATGHIVDLIYAPSIVIVEKKKEKKELTIKDLQEVVQMVVRNVNLPSVCMHSMHGIGIMYKHMQSSVTYLPVHARAGAVCRSLPLSRTSVPQRVRLVKFKF